MEESLVSSPESVTTGDPKSREQMLREFRERKERVLLLSRTGLETSQRSDRRKTVESAFQLSTPIKAPDNTLSLSISRTVHQSFLTPLVTNDGNLKIKHTDITETVQSRHFQQISNLDQQHEGLCVELSNYASHPANSSTLATQKDSVFSVQNERMILTIADELRSNRKATKSVYEQIISETELHLKSTIGKSQKDQKSDMERITQDKLDGHSKAQSELVIKRLEELQVKLEEYSTRVGVHTRKTIGEQLSPVERLQEIDVLVNHLYLKAQDGSSSSNQIQVLEARERELASLVSQKAQALSGLQNDYSRIQQYIRVASQQLRNIATTVDSSSSSIPESHRIVSASGIVEASVDHIVISLMDQNNTLKVRLDESLNELKLLKSRLHEVHSVPSAKPGDSSQKSVKKSIAPTSITGSPNRTIRPASPSIKMSPNKAKSIAESRKTPQKTRNVAIVTSLEPVADHAKHKGTPVEVMAKVEGQFVGSEEVKKENEAVDNEEQHTAGDIEPPSQDEVIRLSIALEEERRKAQDFESRIELIEASSRTFQDQLQSYIQRLIAENEKLTMQIRYPEQHLRLMEQKAQIIGAHFEGLDDSFSESIDGYKSQAFGSSLSHVNSPNHEETNDPDLRRLQEYSSKSRHLLEELDVHGRGLQSENTQLKIQLQALNEEGLQEVEYLTKKIEIYENDVTSKHDVIMQLREEIRSYVQLLTQIREKEASTQHVLADQIQKNNHQKVEIEHYQTSNERLRERVQELENRVSQLLDHEHQLEQEAVSLRATISDLEMEAQRYLITIKDTLELRNSEKEKLREAELQRKRLESRIIELSEAADSRNQNAQLKDDRLVAEKRMMDAKFRELQESIQEKDLLIEKLRNEVEISFQTATSMEQLTTEAVEKLSKCQEKLQSQAVDYQKSVEALRIENGGLKTRLESENARLFSLGEDYAKLETKHNLFVQNSARELGDAAKSKTQILHLTRQLEEVSANYQALRIRADSDAKRVITLQSEVDILQESLQLLVKRILAIYNIANLDLTLEEKGGADSVIWDGKDPVAYSQSICAKLENVVILQARRIQSSLADAEADASRLRKMNSELQQRCDDLQGVVLKMEASEKLIEAALTENLSINDQLYQALESAKRENEELTLRIEKHTHEIRVFASEKAAIEQQLHQASEQLSLLNIRGIEERSRMEELQDRLRTLQLDHQLETENTRSRYEEALASLTRLTQTLDTRNTALGKELLSAHSEIEALKMRRSELEARVYGTVTHL
eukprot:TRINITY_DN4515_c0_g1_i6.p1 TRINITY_DN4515_c0_g1~~TRINITY_DN4515_c0_g1_i6.p1  ORF type:complete len:1261 (+),score=266.40 TRINITY_DN4515_c0_g1_i6:107-3889(+)